MKLIPLPPEWDDENGLCWKCKFLDNSRKVAATVLLVEKPLWEDQGFPECTPLCANHAEILECEYCK